jgi:NAD(P)-dependent dehydrogenase (short-subunit alcohol dehydrogenase family)
MITGPSSGSEFGIAETFAAAGCRLLIDGIATPERDG